jgi:uncharacterized protein
MSDSVLERFIQQYIAAQASDRIDFQWQGGEPTLRGIGFFKKVLYYQKKHCPPVKIISNSLQTNGFFLDEEWCKFLSDNFFLVGISIDGPKYLHDCYRYDANHNSYFDKLCRSIENLKRFGVEYNTLTVVNNLNSQAPLEVYKFLRDEISSNYIQFIPCVEPVNFEKQSIEQMDENRAAYVGAKRCLPGFKDSCVTDWSVAPLDYGIFLATIFEEWVKNDVGKTFVRIFDNMLGLWMGMPSSSCYFSQICGKALAIEHDGEVYSCDHYVYPEHSLGNVKTGYLREMLFSEKQIDFGLGKADKLPEYCKSCKYLFACNGECPKNRFTKAPDGEYGLNYLCPGLKHFFEYIEPRMESMAEAIRAGKPANSIMINK